jgi:hypothetical protein
LTLACVAAAGQSRPDFSGDWVLNRQGSTPREDAFTRRTDGADSSETGPQKRVRAREQGRSSMGNHDAVWIYDRR